MELSQLRCFAAVAEELHFGRAAARLFMSQPPLSRQIQLLEHALGVTLFERTSRSVRLTAAGRAFYAEAVLILQRAEAAAVMARQIEQGEAGLVTVGFTAVSGYQLVPELVREAAKDLSGLTIVLREMVSIEQMRALAAHAVDMGFVRPVNVNQAFEYALLRSEPLMVALPRGHVLAGDRKIKASDFENQPLIMYSPDEGKYFFDLVTGLFAASSVHPQPTQHIGQTHTILSLVRAGLGLAIVPASARRIFSEDIVFRPIWRNDFCAETHLVWRRDHQNPALDRLRDFALEHFRSGGRDALRKTDADG